MAHALRLSPPERAARELRREVNHKRVYREEGLAMRIRQRRRIRWNGADVAAAISEPVHFGQDCRRDIVSYVGVRLVDGKRHAGGGLALRSGATPVRATWSVAPRVGHCNRHSSSGCDG